MITTDQIQSLLSSGGTVVGRDGSKIGAAGQVFLDDQTGNPEWVTVKTGLFGGSESFVPLAQASSTGSDITVPYDKSMVKDAPRMDADGHLSPEQEDELYAYYGLSQPSAPTTGREQRDDSTGEAGVVGHDTSGPTTDNAMTRSEEHLQVGIQQREAGRARLRKFVTTETQAVNVPVSHDEVRITREPVTDANRAESVDGPTITDAVHEVVLREEVPVVAVEAEAVERVRVDVDTVTETETVSGEVRKENIELVEQDDTTPRGNKQR